eukprot:m.42622 g.42622  ORF g.42622 m.42622 type:complete len:338 (-) comp17025_c0_seq3:42-1055(-)
MDSESSPASRRMTFTSVTHIRPVPSPSKSRSPSHSPLAHLSAHQHTPPGKRSSSTLSHSFSPDSHYDEIPCLDDQVQPDSPCAHNPNFTPSTETDTPLYADFEPQSSRLSSPPHQPPSLQGLSQLSDLSLTSSTSNMSTQSSLDKPTEFTNPYFQADETEAVTVHTQQLEAALDPEKVVMTVKASYLGHTDSPNPDKVTACQTAIEELSGRHCQHGRGTPDSYSASSVFKRSILLKLTSAKVYGIDADDLETVFSVNILDMFLAILSPQFKGGFLFGKKKDVLGILCKDTFRIDPQGPRRVICHVMTLPKHGSKFYTRLEQCAQARLNATLASHSAV